MIVAEAMTLVTSVVGVAERADGRWYYLDDGVYGAYSNVVAEDVHPLRVRGDGARLTHPDDGTTGGRRSAGRRATRPTWSRERCCFPNSAVGDCW